MTTDRDRVEEACDLWPSHPILFRAIAEPDGRAVLAADGE